MSDKTNNKQLKSEIRSQIRKIRNTLDPDYQNKAANLLVDKLQTQQAFNQAKRIACFLSFDGEISTKPLIQEIISNAKQCYLPKLKPYKPNRLWFMPYDQSTPMINNKYGIPEVDLPVNRAIAPSQLDIVLLPLVAFDKNGNRLGMGGGYYDATFAHLKSQQKRPVFVGLAYAEQQVKSLPYDPWDLSLDAVCTNKNFISFC